MPRLIPKCQSPWTKLTTSIKDGFGALFGIPIENEGRHEVKVEKDDYGNYTFNGRKPADGYQYYDRNDGNIYKFINGKRTLVKQSDKSKQITRKQQKYSEQTKKNIEKDISIGNTKNYGIDDNATAGGWNVDRLYRNINPLDGISFANSVANMIPYAIDWGSIENRSKGHPGDEALWKRHLGYTRDYKEMPATGIRFAGDYNKDGTPRLPNAEYSGIPQYAKKTILQNIKDGKINVNPDGTWTGHQEGWINPRNKGISFVYFENPDLTQYANFSMRENNGSGIYDFFDTYDLPYDWYMPNLNRKNGYQIEIRDTIHGPNAIPELWDPEFSSRK